MLDLSVPRSVYYPLPLEAVVCLTQKSDEGDVEALTIESINLVQLVTRDFCLSRPWSKFAGLGMFWSGIYEM